jgi:7-cyano-7-deazaguanine synthase
MNKKAIVLLSGGMDSTTLLALAQSQQYECYALSFRYGQRHQAELDAASQIAQEAKVIRHEIIDLDLSRFGGSALTDHSIDVPDSNNDTYDDNSNSHIPITYVPARNTVFLSIALGWAETLNANDIFIGVTAVDYSGYPDCRPEFIQSFQDMANLATKAGVEGHPFNIQTPLIHLSKAEIIQLGHQLGVDYAKTVTCYSANKHGQACGVCDACDLRRKGFEAANIIDNTRYSA